MLKKAFLVGINDYRDAPLRGCVNDVMQMQEALTNLFGFASENMRVLLDREATTSNLTAGLKWLAEGGDAQSVRVFHYAGHGHFVPDQNGDEPDGSDEALVPYDYAQKDFLIDDHLKQLYDRFPANANLTLIMDCCHSGTIQRNPNFEVAYRFLPNTWEEKQAIVAARKKFHEEQRKHVIEAIADLRGRNAANDEFQSRVDAAMRGFEKQRFGDYRVREGNVLLAACQSDQKAADAKMQGQYHGAFTFNLVNILQETRGQITYHELAEKVGSALHEQDFMQIPQLECETGREAQQVLSIF